MSYLKVPDPIYIEYPEGIGKNINIGDVNQLIDKKIVNATTDANVVPRYTLVDRTPDERKKFINKLKLAIAKDLTTNGVPIKHFNPEFIFTYRGMDYTIDITILAYIENFRYPIGNMRENDFSPVLHFTRKPMDVPAMLNNEFTILQLQAGVANDLLTEYRSKLVKYGFTISKLLKDLGSVTFTDTYTISTLWNNLYGTSPHGFVEYVKLT